MDALGTAVGVASLGIQVCQGVLSYYDRWKGCHSDISSTYESVADLARTFTILKTNLTRPAGDNEGEDSRECKTRVETCLNACTEGLERLQKRLSKLRSYSEPQGLRQKAWAEMQRAWYPFRASTIAKLKENVGELQDGLSLALQTLHQVTVDRGFRRTADGMSSILSNQLAAGDRISEVLVHQQIIQSEISDVLSAQQAAKHRSIVDWLSPPDPSYNHNTARKRHEPDTGSWLLQSGQYKHWKASTDTVLWLTGKAGCGKTVLCSTVIEDLRLQCRSAPDTRLAFFYFSFSDIQKQSYAGLLASLIAQLSQDNTVLNKLHQAYDKMQSSRPSTETLEDILAAYLQQPGQTILVLDALDELPESSSDDGRPAVLEWLGRIMQASDQTKVFVTSRQLTDIQTSVTSLGARCVLLQPELANNDIRKYVATELEKHPKLRKYNPDVKKKIQEVFEQKADGMFRWAFCQLEVLKSLKSTKPKFVEQALHGLPSTLDETYERMLLQIDEMLREEALTALRWLVFETRPLTLGELAEACLIDYASQELFDDGNRGQIDDVLEILAGLVLVEDSQHDSDDDNSDDDDINSSEVLSPLVTTLEAQYSSVQQATSSSRIRLAHFSVKEYLLSSRILDSKAAPFALKQEDDYPILAQSCLAYVLYYSQSSSKTMSEQDLDTYLLLQYAAETWPTFIPKHKSTQPMLERRLLQSETCRRTWTLIYMPDRPWEKPFDYFKLEVGPPLYYASLLGIVSLCESLLKEGSDVNARGGEYGNVLQAASEGGHREVVQLLLGAGADANAQGREYYSSALQAASGEGYREIVQLLLDAGADVNAQGGHYGSALQAASAGGYREIVQLLLDAGADVNAQGGYYSSALQAASARGHREIVQLLLGAGADVNAQGGRHSSALQAASQGGHREIVQLLLGAGADVNAQRGGYGSALQAASARGHREIVQLLLNTGADVNAQGREYYSSALQAASGEGYREIVQLLLDAGADVNAQGGHYGSALQAASAGGYREIVQLLLDAGADVDARGYYGNALQAASYKGYQEIVQLLLVAGADVNAQGGHYGSALQAASVRGHQEIVQILRTAGAQDV